MKVECQVEGEHFQSLLSLSMSTATTSEAAKIVVDSRNLGFLVFCLVYRGLCFGVEVGALSWRL